MAGNLRCRKELIMTGSLQIKRDKFFIVLNTYDKDGKRKQKWISTDLPVKGNKKRAESLLRDTLRQYEANDKQERTSILFSDAIRQWLEGVALRVDEVTLQGYTTLANGHILPYFDASGVKLVDVDRRILQTYLDEKHRNGRMDGIGGLSPRSLRLHKNILYQTLKEALRDRLIPSNPCDLVTLPKNDRHEAKFYSAEQVNALLAACRDDVMWPLLKLTAVYGLRRSEVLGLKWDSVNFDNNTLTIKHTVSKVTTVVEKDKTKNSSSHRTFPLLPDIRSLLAQLKQQENANRKLFQREYQENDYILKWDDGHPFSPDYVSHHFADLLKKHNLPAIRFHELRHSCASILINQGATLKDVQEWLGHSDISVTADIYSHLDVQRKQGIANMMAGQLCQ